MGGDSWLLHCSYHLVEARAAPLLSASPRLGAAIPGFVLPYEQGWDSYIIVREYLLSVLMMF